MLQKPLAFILRPQSINDIIGQSKVLGSNGIIKRMVKYQHPRSLIFYGPPGSGKTSFAIALAQDLKLPFTVFNASLDKKETLVKWLETSRKSPSVLIIDEIHRMNRDKQDLLLEQLENGQVTTFFTTTENPFFVINPALRSRAHIVKVEPISAQDMFNHLKSLIIEKKIKLKIPDEALSYITQLAAGDLRSAINNLELLINLYPRHKLDLAFVQAVLPQAQVRGAHYGDDLADLKSALQKSVRGSDVDAALYYFGRLAMIGDFETLMRRMIVMAYEDIGLANPQIPVHVMAATDAFRQLGTPEGLIPLGLAIVEMALSEKSNSAYLATQQVIKDLNQGQIYSIPLVLRDTHYKSAAKLGHGQGYKYPHDYPHDWVKQNYLPTELSGKIYYRPKVHSVYEKRVWELYEKMKNSK